MFKKLAIVGGSMAGLMTALNIHHKSVELFEEHETIGFPFKCSGLVNAKLFEKLKIGRQAIQNGLHGSILISPLGRNYLFNLKENIGYVINRPEFERELLIHLDKNVKIYTSKKISSLHVLKGYDLVVGADGTFSRVRRDLGLPPLQFTYGVQYEIRYPQEWPEHVTLFIDKSYTEYHIWNIPVNKKTARIGLACSNIQEGFRCLDKFLNKKMSRYQIVEKMCGAIPVGCLEKIAGDNWALVGDAAGQNRPLSGGGLNFAIKYGQILGNTIDGNNLNEYDNLWCETDAQKNKQELKMLERWKSLSNNQIEKIIKNLPPPDFSSSTLFSALFRSIIEKSNLPIML